MLGCTLKEYKDRFDEKLANYLEEYADNTTISFLENQKILYGYYQYQIQKILSELIIYREENASEVFLESNIFEGLKKIDIDSYQNILIEEKPNDIRRLYAKVGEYRSELKVRINFTILKNIITSVDKIVEFIENKYQIFEQEEKQIITLALGQQHNPANTEATILEEFVPSRLDAEDLVDPDKSMKETIDKYLIKFTDDLSKEDYELLTNSLLTYFLTDNFPKLDRKITFKHLNRKKVGWALKEIYQSFKTEKLNITLLEFAVHNINLFEKYVIPKDNLFRSNIYKAFTTNPKSYKY